MRGTDPTCLEKTLHGFMLLCQSPLAVKRAGKNGGLDDANQLEGFLDQALLDNLDEEVEEEEEVVMVARPAAAADRRPAAYQEESDDEDIDAW